MMTKKQKVEKTARKRQPNQEETRTGYGNKKLEGPDRPST